VCCINTCVQGVSDAQEDLDAAEARRRDAELDIILTLRAMPGAGTGMSAELDQHARGSKIVTVSQKRFISASSHAQSAAGSTAMFEPEPESEPHQEISTEIESDSASAAQQAHAARSERLDGFACPLDRECGDPKRETERWSSSVANDARSLAVDGLKTAPFVVLDDFVGTELCMAVRTEVQRLDEQGHLKEGELGGGRTGTNLTYYNSQVRARVAVQSVASSFLAT
jgi:hypothetical protein